MFGSGNPGIRGRDPGICKPFLSFLKGALWFVLWVTLVSALKPRVRHGPSEPVAARPLLKSFRRYPRLKATGALVGT